MKFWIDLEGLGELVGDLVKDTILGEDLRVVSTFQDDSGNTRFLVKLRRGQVRRLLPAVTEKILKERYNHD